ncbi:MAG: Smf protein, DNA processing protein [Candidatus Peregrinibacteria bacterium GW2011_GWF2_39_17]|nr:MAG: Smf protein, DNA processing protein [Candidatus Peregrinibacteria bacterium GW2011_GWF2_39_17]HCW32389.1 DNA-protecting protein DprA [Candidatus Peregrinibacteria bacterium]
MISFQTLKINDSLYPDALQQLRDAPPLLYARGNLSLLKSTCFAIVGTRANTDYGQAMAAYFTKGLLSYGFTIVSGLAYGIDAAVHRAVVEAGGKTIAVLGNGIDTIHPARHQHLAQDILRQNGLIFSEYGPGAGIRNYFFPKRNRLISGISIGTLIIEAPQKSGALITARCAFEQNRDVFAVPGDLSRHTFQGNHSLISSDMARLVRTPEDIISHLSHQPKLVLKNVIHHPKTQLKLVTVAQKNLWEIFSFHPQSIEDLLAKSRLSIEECLVALSYFELKGYIRQESNQKFCKISEID